MIKFEKPEVWGWEHAIRGMRNPLNSWERSDSYPAVDCGKCGIIDREGICHPKEHDCTPYECYAIGDNDKDLMTRLIRGGAPHRKFLRQIFVSVDITAPLYWWKEFDTYKVGTTANSCSTMHKIQAKEFTFEEGRCKTCIGIYHMVGSEQNADGSYTSSAMQWCKFKDMENGVIGYFDFINIPNYKNLKGVTDPRKYLENIKADGYATSHKYVDNLMRVIETWHLTDYDKKEETKMSNSPLVVYTNLSPNHSGQRTHSIDRITPHCVVGQLSAESICGCFISTSRQASCNYGIGTDGRISMSVEEKNRSWCSSSRENDQRAVTIECASDKTAPYAFNDAVYASLVNLCVDICQRNGKSKLLWLGDKNKTLAYAPKSDEMVLTVHRWFANKSCPGDWLYNRLGNLAAEVTKRLTGGSTDTGKVDVPSDGKTLYRVQTGAFSKRSNADAWAAKLKAAGFDTYIVQMGNLYKVQVGAYSQKSNAENMMAKLKAAGYDAFITTKSGTAAGTAKKSAAEIAKEIYNGTCSDSRWSSWGNGADRVNRLKQAGYDPNEVQSEVNKLF